MVRMLPEFETTGFVDAGSRLSIFFSFHTPELNSIYMPILSSARVELYSYFTLGISGRCPKEVDRRGSSAMLLVAWLYVSNRVLDCAVADFCAKEWYRYRYTELGISCREHVSILHYTACQGRFVLLWPFLGRCTLGF